MPSISKALWSGAGSAAADPPVHGAAAGGKSYAPHGWSPRPDSNRGPFPYQGNALPPELRGRDSIRFYLLQTEGQIMPTIDEVLDSARRRLRRVTPQEASAEHANGALL